MDSSRLRGSLLCHADGVVEDSPTDALVSSEGAGAELDSRANSSGLVAAKLGDLGMVCAVPGVPAVPEGPAGDGDEAAV